MKKNVKVNPIEKTITISKAFFKRASVFGSSEYYELRNAMKENPDYEVIITTVQKNVHKDLTFKRMEAYIRTQPNSEANLKEFRAVQEIAEAKGAKYPLTKKWFFKTFPEYKLNEVSENETEAILNKSEHHTNIFEDVAA